jgi:hypothetical protein
MNMDRNTVSRSHECESELRPLTGLLVIVRCERVAFDRIHARIRREQELDQTVP